MKSALVSGAGSGIGRAISQALAASGFKLIMLGRNQQKLEETKKGLENPNLHLCLAVDTTDARALRDAFNAIDLPSLNLSALIANAGIGGENNYGENDRWNEIIETNLSGTYKLVNEALPALRKSQEEYKHVMLTSSILARLGVPHYSAYCASKAGLLGLMRSWAMEWSREKILVNAICPGWVETAMARQGIEGIAKATQKNYDEIYKQQMSMVPLQKMSTPSEIAWFINYIVSSGQSSFTGQSFDMNNGAIMP